MGSLIMSLPMIAFVFTTSVVVVVGAVVAVIRRRQLGARATRRLLIGAGFLLAVQVHHHIGVAGESALGHAAPIVTALLILAAQPLGIALIMAAAFADRAQAPAAAPVADGQAGVAP